MDMRSLFAKRLGRRLLKGTAVSVAVLMLFTLSVAAAATAVILLGKQSDGTIVVPTNQILHPAGTTTLLGQRPVDMVLRPDGKQLAIVTTSLTYLVDPVSGAVTQAFDKGDRSFAGLAYSPDGTHLYYSRGTSHEIGVAAIDASGKATIEEAIDTGDKTWPAGLSINPDGKTLYVAFFGTNSLGVVDLATKKVTQTIAVGSSPFGAYVAPDGKTVYISNWGGTLPAKGDSTDPIFPVKVDPKTGATTQGSVSVYDTTSGKVTAEITVGLHPTEMTFDKATTRLYVANSNEDTISVLNLTAAPQTEIERIPVRPADGLPFGSMPNGLALSSDGSTLYVANGGNNAVAVIALSPEAKSGGTVASNSISTIKGFIPTEWFPVSVRLSPDNQQLYVANNKGEGSLNNVAGYEAKSVFNLTGSVSLIAAPSADQLATYTTQVDANSRYAASLSDALQKPRTTASAVPVPERVGEPSVFKHVIYILKENRTYDQIFGDMSKGNGDPKLAQFPLKVSPNHHALADRFGLFDNYYASAVNSADGHQWTDEAIANVFSERVYGNYPNNSPYPTTAYGSDSLNLSPDTLWSSALAHNVSLRNYGEDSSQQLVVVKQKQTDGTYKALDQASWSDTYKNWAAKGDAYQFESTAITAPLLKTEDRAYPGFKTSITDQIRVDEWEREFKDYVTNNNLPQLSVVWLPDDHTSGVQTGAPMPSAQVADNDLALGRIIDTLSHSAYWKDTVVFVTEDDAQDGTDHVDGHRTVGMVISAYNKPGQVNSTLYNQTSMVRTIEQILGLPPMNQFDLTATPMSDAFTDKPDLTPYAALPNQIQLDELNGQPKALSSVALKDSVLSNAMDFSAPDANDETVLNQIIWRATMGDQPYPSFEWQQRVGVDAQPVDDGDPKTSSDSSHLPSAIQNKDDNHDSQ